MTNKATMINGDIYPSNKCGKFKIVNYINCSNVEIEFVDTGYKSTVEATQIKKGTVKDRFFPSIFDVGFLGDGDYKTRLSGRPTKAYDTWASMIRRCYSEKVHNSLYPTYKDCSVVIEWHNFQSFAKWFDDNYIEGCNIDKDIKIKGNRVYSPDACLFVTKAVNTAASSAKNHTIKDPDGNVININNLERYCRDNDLSSDCMYRVISGKNSSHQGYTKAS